MTPRFLSVDVFKTLGVEQQGDREHSSMVDRMGVIKEGSRALEAFKAAGGDGIVAYSLFEQLLPLLPSDRKYGNESYRRIITHIGNSEEDEIKSIAEDALNSHKDVSQKDSMLNGVASGAATELHGVLNHIFNMMKNGELPATQIPQPLYTLLSEIGNSGKSVLDFMRENAVMTPLDIFAIARRSLVQNCCEAQLRHDNKLSEHLITERIRNNAYVVGNVGVKFLTS